MLQIPSHGPAPKHDDSTGTDPNPHYLALSISHDKQKPRPNEDFSVEVEDRCFAIGLGTDSPEEIILIRYLLHHTGVPNVFTSALNLAFCACLPHVQNKLAARNDGRATYYTHPRYGSLPDAYIERGKKLYDKLKAAAPRSHKKREDATKKVFMDGIGEAVEAISNLCDIGPQEFFNITRGGYGTNYHPADALIRAAIRVRIKCAQKEVCRILKQFLGSVEAFEAGAGLYDYQQNKGKPGASTGSHTRPGLKSGKWAPKLPGWVEEGKNAARDNTTTEEYLDSLVYRPFRAQLNEEPRKRFQKALRLAATRDGYPRPNKVCTAMYRTFDPHAGKTWKRPFVGPEKDVILYYVGQVDYVKDMSGAMNLASDQVGAMFEKVGAFLSSLKDLKAAVREVLARYPDEESPPELPAPSAIRALQAAEHAEAATSTSGANAGSSATSGATSASFKITAGRKSVKRSADSSASSAKTNKSSKKSRHA